MIRIGFGGAMHPGLDAILPTRRAPDFHRVAFFGGYFGCVEVDTTAHVIPAREHVARWGSALASNPRTKLVLRVPGALVDRQRSSEERATDTDRFLKALTPLLRRERLGALVANLPADQYVFGPSEVRLLAQLGRALKAAPLVLEAQHASWYAPTALDAVRGTGWSLAYVEGDDHWDAPPLDHGPTGPVGLLRMTRSGPIPPPTVGRLAARAKTLEPRFQTLFVLAGDGRGEDPAADVGTALEIKHVLGGQRPVKAWQEVVAARPQLREICEIVTSSSSPRHMP